MVSPLLFLPYALPHALKWEKQALKSEKQHQISFNSFSCPYFLDYSIFSILSFLFACFCPSTLHNFHSICHKTWNKKTGNNHEWGFGSQSICHYNFFVSSFGTWGSKVVLGEHGLHLWADVVETTSKIKIRYASRIRFSQDPFANRNPKSSLFFSCLPLEYLSYHIGKWTLNLFPPPKVDLMRKSTSVSVLVWFWGVCFVCFS